MQHSLARHLLFILLLVPCAPLLGGCGEDASARPAEMTRQLPPSAFLGKWRLSEKSVSQFVRDGFVPPPPGTPEAPTGLPASVTDGLPPGVVEGLTRSSPAGVAPEPVYMIEFNNDGWAKFESVVDDVPGGTYTRCLGTWQVRHDVIIENEPRANVIEIQLMRPNCRYFLKLSVREDEGNLFLWNTYKDPKSLETVEYQRIDYKKKLGW